MTENQVLTEAANVDLANYDPQTVIVAVNALVPMGKESALGAIEALLAQNDLNSNPQTGLFLVLRVLFKVPAEPGFQPPIRLGGSAPPPPAVLRSLPHYPLVVIDDRPLLLISSYTLGGLAEPLTEHIQHFRVHGTLRDQPLAPSEAPETVFAQFQELYEVAYEQVPSQHEMVSIKRQLGWM